MKKVPSGIMASKTNTLISLAILKVDLDEGFRDYLGYFENFIVSLLRKHQPDPILASDIAMLFQVEYGLRVPEKGVQLILRRLARKKYIKRKDKRFHIAGDLPSVDLHTKREAAERHIEHVYAQLRIYAKSNYGVDWTDADIDKALLGFLSRFAVECIRAYVYSTALPETPISTTTNQVIVSNFIHNLYKNQDATFESIIVLVKGQMYANALICPDLESIQKNFKRVTFYCDTPVVLSALGFQTEADAAATRELLSLLTRLKGRLAIFSHTVDEIDIVLEFAENNIDRPDVSGRILKHFRDRGIKRGDIAIFRGNLSENLQHNGFKVHRSPKYDPNYQIDEAALEQALRENLSYRSARGAEYDANSVRSVFTLRRGRIPRRLEDCNAVVVTDNQKFARIAFEHGKNHNSSREVSSVITDYSLANVAWLKAPLGAPSLPEKETLAACHAALEPNVPLWEKYLTELDNLSDKGLLNPDEHAMLRVSGIASTELIELTQGDEKAFGPDTVSQILTRVKSSLVAEQTQALQRAKGTNAILVEQKNALELREENLSKKLFWLSGKLASILTLALFAVAVVALSGAVFGSVILTAPWVQNSRVMTACLHGLILIGGLWAIANECFGVELIGLREKIKKRIHAGILNRLRSWLIDYAT